MSEPKTVREVLEDRIRDTLCEFFDHHLQDLVSEFSNEACSALGISDKEQAEPWDTSEGE